MIRGCIPQKKLNAPAFHFPTFNFIYYDISYFKCSPLQIIASNVINKNNHILAQIKQFSAVHVQHMQRKKTCE